MTETRRTEQVHPDFAHLDRLPPHDLVQALAADQQHAIDAVQQAVPALTGRGAFGARRGRSACNPRRRAAQSVASGHSAQTGLRGVQIVAPRSIMA